ncbi:MAG: alpha/beta hydrolase [Methylophaga sp.]|nr:MAG: alpha/beta hydrolase [Methylophaga sp.]
MTKIYQLTFLSLLISGCTTVPSMDKRHNTAEQLASQHAWHEQIIETASFNLISFVPNNPIKDSTLTVYIEGDGMAWISSRKPSRNPTPINPVGLKLALNHPSTNSAYLARPCQYLMNKPCETKYWASHRFSPEVIEASNQAVDKLKQQFSATRLTLVGYSGGGAVATILAAQRDDVVKLITMAGNLDHKAWTNFHHISPLTGSLNPADYLKQLTTVEQVHFVGEDDTVIPPFLAYGFVAKLPASSHAKVILVLDQDHDCCWESIWPNLYESID